MSFQQHLLTKIIAIEAITRFAELKRFMGKRIVFTNGCFDILHKGHVDYLTKARDLGDVLIVGLNSDASVKRLGKSVERPINNQEARGFLLAGLSAVDAVCVFEEDTPLELIKLIKPHILVKGGDYKPENIVGYDVVKANGGEVLTIDLVEGFSTTNIVNQLKQGG
jgi:D-glycero-beta-D-manno-heptose 1-phosphate adenylyltransferase